MYESLFAVLLATCGADTHEIELRAELDTGWADLNLQCRAEDGEWRRASLFGGQAGEIYRELDQIRTAFRDASGSTWNTCRFHSVNGEFSMTFGY